MVNAGPGRTVRVGSLHMGGGAPVSVQTMWDAPLRAVDAPLIERLESLRGLGCDLVRFAVPGFPDVGALGDVARRLSMPVVADIHYNHRLALACMDHPIAKIRINPGTIAGSGGVEEVVRKAGDTGTALRVGVNGGSLPKSLRGEKDPAKAMVAAAEEELDILERLNFDQVVFSLKSSSIDTTVRANRLFSETHDYPLHLGVTEAGPLIPGITKSVLALGELLRAGIGATLRVSLSAAPEREVEAGESLLLALGLRRGMDIVSCPRCGRTEFDVEKFVAIVSKNRHSVPPGTRVAVMGCPVNGPGEAREADLGISGSGREACIFRGGEIVRRVPLGQAEQALKDELERL